MLRPAITVEPHLSITDFQNMYAIQRKSVFNQRHETGSLKVEPERDCVLFGFVVTRSCLKMNVILMCMCNT